MPSSFSNRISVFAVPVAVVAVGAMACRSSVNKSLPSTISPTALVLQPLHSTNQDLTAISPSETELAAIQADAPQPFDDFSSADAVAGWRALLATDPAFHLSNRYLVNEPAFGSIAVGQLYHTAGGQGRIELYQAPFPFPFPEPPANATDERIGAFSVSLWTDAEGVHVRFPTGDEVRGMKVEALIDASGVDENTMRRFVADLTRS